MKTNPIRFLILFLALLLSYGEPAHTQENSTWYFQETPNILKKIENYLSSTNLKPYLHKGKITFCLDGYEVNSGSNNLAFPIGKISQNGKSYYAMFFVKKIAKSSYNVKLICISTEMPPSLILLLDVLSQIDILNQISDSKIENYNIFIERLSHSKNPDIIYSKWTLFQPDAKASFYVTTKTDKNGETDFSVRQVP